jgi:hypothetical protein
MFEQERFIEFDIVSTYSRFFLQLAQRTLQIRFARIDMPFRQVPAIWVAHEQKLTRLAFEHDDAARSDFGHGDAAD